MRIQQKHKTRNTEGTSYTWQGGFTQLEVTEGSGYIIHLLKHWRSSEEESSKMIPILYAWNLMSTRGLFPIFEHPEIELPHLKGKIIPAI